MANGFGYYRAFSTNADQTREARKMLTIPVLTVGAESGVGSSLGTAMEKIVTNVTTKVIADCGHYVAEERPEALSELLLDFWATTPSSRASLLTAGD